MSLKEIYKREPIRDKNWIFPYGKHKGETLQDVMDEDPNYIHFLQAKDICDFHSDIFDEIEEDFSRGWRNTRAQMIEDW